MASVWLSIFSLFHLSCPTAVANAHARGSQCEGGLCQASGHSLLQRTNFEHQQQDILDGEQPQLEIQPIDEDIDGQTGEQPELEIQPIEENTDGQTGEGPLIKPMPINDMPMKPKPINDAPVIKPIKPINDAPVIKPMPINDMPMKPKPINDDPVIKPIINPIGDLHAKNGSNDTGSNDTTPAPAPEPEPTPEPDANKTGLPCPDNSTNFSIPKEAMEQFEKSCHTHLNASLKDMEKDVEEHPDVIGVLLKMCEEGTPEHEACFGQLLDYFEDCNASQSNLTSLQEGLDAMCKLVELLAASMGSSSMPNMTSIEETIPDQMS